MNFPQLHTIRLFQLCIILAAISPAWSADEAQKKAPFTIPVSGMRLDPEARNQVSGLALTLEDNGCPAITMLGHPFSIIGALNCRDTYPLGFGAIRQEGTSQLIDQQINDVANTLTYLNDKQESLKVTVTRLSPAILLESTGKEVELFGSLDSPATDGNPKFPYPAGYYKPLRWAIPGADGKVITGLLAKTPTNPTPGWMIEQNPSKPSVPPSTMPEEIAMPPVDSLGRTWLLLWYGLGSPFVSSKIPSVFTGQEPYSGVLKELNFQADAPLLFIFEKPPRSIEMRKEGNVNRLIVSFPDQAGKVVMLPLFGHDLQAAATTEQWLKDFPADLKTRCEDWANRLAEFPVSVKEENTYDEKADRLTTTESFEFVNVRPEGDKMALVPPMLGIGLQHKLPVVVTPEPQDLKYATQFGPLLGISGDHYEWYLDGLGKYVKGQPVIGPSTERSAVLEKELSAQIDKVLAAGHLAPLIISRQAPWLPGFGTTYWKDPSEMLYYLSEFMPLLPEAQQIRVRDYLNKEFASYPPDKILQLKVEEGARREFGLLPLTLPKKYNAPIGASLHGDEYTEPEPSLYRAYGVGRYFLATNQKPAQEVIDYWRGAMHQSLVGRDWATLGWFWGKYASLRHQNFKTFNWRSDYWQFTPRAIQRDAAGLIGYLRLCQLNGEKGEPEAWGQLARLLAFRFALVEYGRYLAESGLFQMPEVDSESYKLLSRSGDFSKPENHCEQVWEVNQHEVTMYSGILKINNADYYTGFMVKVNNGSGNNQILFSDLTPELGQILSDWGLKEDVARCVKQYAEIDPIWYKAKSDSEHLTRTEIGLTLPSDSYQYFIADAWIAGAPPEELEKYIDVPWSAIGDFFYMEKLAETIKAYRGVKWEAGKQVIPSPQ